MVWGGGVAVEVRVAEVDFSSGKSTEIGGREVPRLRGRWLSRTGGPDLHPLKTMELWRRVIGAKRNWGVNIHILLANFRNRGF